MNDQEILTYINSKDVRKYLWESGYKFSSSEAAWLVYNQEDISLENKFIAWRSIIDTMPDMEFNCYEPRFSSFHSVLLDYMTLQIENLRFLFSNTPDYYYEIVVQNRNNGKSFGSEHGYFSSYDKCYKSMIEISNPDQKKIIKKRPINQPDAPTINAEYNSKNEISALEFDAESV